MTLTYTLKADLGSDECITFALNGSRYSLQVTSWKKRKPILAAMKSVYHAEHAEAARAVADAGRCRPSAAIPGGQF